MPRPSLTTLAACLQAALDILFLLYILTNLGYFQ